MLFSRLNDWRNPAYITIEKSVISPDLVSFRKIRGHIDKVKKYALVKDSSDAFITCKSTIM